MRHDRRPWRTVRVAFALFLGALIGPAAWSGEGGGELAPVEAFDDDQRGHWAYRPIDRPDPPEVDDPAWIRNPIDRFILAEMEALDFEPGPEADRVSLIRRLTFDLTGLPPTPGEVAAFLGDHRPDAYDRLIDGLLGRPSFGERWAQHWLDLAHYADSNGFELDADRPDAWRYRDWVVGAINDDLPYDEFLTLQLAGDEARPGDPRALVATGFGRCGPREVVGGNIDPKVRRQSELTGVTGTVGSVFLGLTIGCARCHDHKFDAIPTTDYYRLQAFFEAAEMVELPIHTEREQADFDEAKARVAERTASLREELAALEAPYRAALRAEKEAGLSEDERVVLAMPEGDRTPIQRKLAEGAEKALAISWEEVAEAVAADPDAQADRERLKRAIFEVERTLPPPPARAMGLAEPGEGEPEVPATFVYRRGDPQLVGPEVGPRPLGVVLANMGAEAFEPASIGPVGGRTGRRVALARWMTRADNPLTARVIVNRLWQHHLGRGIVASPSDFGVRGELPSHPGLLDWLASELVAGGWRLKPIHRLIVSSSTYRQASDPRRSVVDEPGELSRLVDRARRQAGDDPDNLLVSRVDRRRLEAESLRDALLAVTGELNPQMGGPGVRAPIPPEVEELIFTEAEEVDLWPEDPDPSQHLRRSLYLHRKRNVRVPLFDAFDAPDTQTSCAVRDVSTHPLQSLILLNSRFAIDRAKALAGRLFEEVPGGDADRVDRAYRLVLARGPTGEESGRAIAFLEGQAELLRSRAAGDPPLASPVPGPEGIDPARAAAWVDFALAMLNRNEFVYVP
ncbi:DUF1549 and DUF1553 domain-containing protein [Tautonia plasticadhaerens]|uniref:Planctomycete cytochrome C n=1 Tax=Tautonia plasticadhaerens TaxID=2527974 RepID=A0A518GXS0_9BACT|nr:DUF1549 and DUF1553 domain-containing protein [Tautonia plasticadhaerens]QDV33390.1 hypothetical protein ElP_12610 [Tautonia plasticadhaerens]